MLANMRSLSEKTNILWEDVGFFLAFLSLFSLSQMPLFHHLTITILDIQAFQDNGVLNSWSCQSFFLIHPGCAQSFLGLSSKGLWEWPKGKTSFCFVARGQAFLPLGGAGKQEKLRVRP